MSNFTERSRLVEETKVFKAKKVKVEACQAYKLSEIELRKAELEIDRMNFDHCLYKLRMCIVTLVAVSYFVVIFWLTIQDFALWKLLCGCVATPLGVILTNLNTLASV